MEHVLTTETYLVTEPELKLIGMYQRLSFVGHIEWSVAFEDRRGMYILIENASDFDNLESLYRNHKFEKSM